MLWGVEMLLFLSGSSIGYIFLELLSSSRWSFMARKLSLNRKALLKKRALRKSIF